MSKDVDGSESSGSLSLKFLSGKSQGTEYVFDREAREVVVGRNSDADLILLEGMVSRYHAKFIISGRDLIIEDLGSTNGTFVNGTRVQRRVLCEADRVLIGDCILKVVMDSDISSLTMPTPRIDDELIPDESTCKSMAGLLEDVMAAELLEIFATSHRAATIRLKSYRGGGAIIVREGIVEGATLDELPSASPHKCVNRLLGWSKGGYIVEPYQPPTAGSRLDIPIPQLLIEALFKVDEFNLLSNRLPTDGRILLAKPLLPPLRLLDDEDLDLLQSAHNLGIVNSVLDESPQPDLEVAKRLLRLLDAGYLRPG